jgi:inosose dehydratase
MPQSDTDALLTRRMLLRRWALGAGALPLLASLAARGAQTAIPAPPYPFKLGLQSYSLRNFPLDDALAKTKELGLTWWEGYPGHIPLTEDAGKIASYRDTLKTHGVRMISYGVVDFTSDEADARKKFAFAKAMGIRTLTAAPKPDALPLLDKLTQEYAINIGIHNHGPDDHQWGDWQVILDAIKGFNPRVGACDDTGHYLRADKNPITAAVQFGKRLHSIHLKNVEIGPNQTKHFVPIGTTGGLLDSVQLLRFLKEQKYMGIMAIEEEEQADNPMPLIAKSVEAMHRYINTANTIKLKSD